MGEVAQSIGGLLGRIEDFISAEQMAARRNKVATRLEDNRSQGRDYGQLYQDSYLARNRDNMPASVNAMQTAQYFMPGVGEVLDFGEGVTELMSDNPNYATAGGLLAAAGLGLIPGAGDMAARGVGAAARGAKRAGGGLLDAGRRFGDEGVDFLRGTSGSVPPSGLLGDAPQPRMIVHHNTSPEKLAFTDELGGMPYPSLAISRADAPLENFGGISLIGGPEMAVPDRFNKVFRGDGYTLRQPRPTLKIDEKTFAKEIASDPRFSHLRGPNWFIDSYTNLEDADRAFKRLELAISKGDVDPKDFTSMDDLMDASRKALKYSDDASDLPGLRQYADVSMELDPEDLFTASGNRRKGKPYTLENVTARMKREGGKSGSEGFNYGVPSFRANAEPPLRSFRQVSEARNTISPRSEVEGAFDSFQGAYNTVLRNIADETGMPGFQAQDQAAEFMNDYARGRAGDWRGSWTDNLSKEFSLGEVDGLIKRSRDLPVEYLEAKPQRAVNLSEFAGAIVPEGEKQALEILGRNGIKKIFTYGSKAERAALFQKFPEFMFSAAAAAMLGVSAQDLKAQAESAMPEPQGLL